MHWHWLETWYAPVSKTVGSRARLMEVTFRYERSEWR